MSGNPPHPWGDYSHCRNFSSYVQSESPQELLVHITPHIFHMTPCKKGVWSLLPFFQYQRVKMSPLCLLFSKLNKPTSLSLSPHARLSPSLLIFVASLWTLSSQSTPFLYSREQTWTQYSRPGKCWVNWDSKFLISAGDALVDAAQPPAGFLCPSCILVTHTELLVHQDPKILSIKLPHRQADPSLCWNSGLCFPRCNTLHLSLLNFTGFFLAHSYRQSRSSCRVASPFLPQFGTMDKLCKGTLDSIFQITYKDIKQCEPNINPLGTPLVTGCHFEKETFSTTQWVLPFSPFPTHGTAHLPGPITHRVNMMLTKCLQEQRARQELSKDFQVWSFHQPKH